MTSSPPTDITPPGRLVSLDALRGFDMFWILGADALVVSIGTLSQSPPARWLAGQLEHQEWAGFAFYDLIFPLFVFIVGVSLVFSLTPALARTPRPTLAKRILRRALILFLLGIFYNGGLSHLWPEVRIAGVLQRIAIAYAATALLFCFLKPRQLAAVAAGVLVSYWALMTFVPIRDVSIERPALIAQLPGMPLTSNNVPARPAVEALYASTTTHVSGHFEPGYNLADHLDFRFLPGRLHDGYYDPEGILSTLPAIATCLLGVFAGLCLQRRDLDDAHKLRQLLIAGLVAIAAGWLWHLQFPVIKKIWTSSYVLVAGGWSFLLLALFYYVVDVRKWRTWCQPFVWIGTNPITLYLASSVLGFHAIAGRLVGGSIAAWFEHHLMVGAGDLLITVTSLGLVFLLARFLYQRRIFLRV